jgi:CheY-like chemotaxis protein
MKPDGLLRPLMMVDDNEDDAVLLTRRLKDAGIKNPLVHFRDGGQAFMFLKQFCSGEKSPAKLPQLMFLDVNMPGLSGFDLLAWARHQPALADMKIVMLSGATEPWDAQIAAKLGANDYATKFPDAAALAQLVGDRAPLAS